MKIKISITILAISILFIASELIFQFRNNPNFKIIVYVYAAKTSTLISSPSIPLAFFENAAKIKIEGQTQKYPEIDFEKEITTPSLPKNEKLLKEYKNIINEIDNNKITNNYGYLASFYYSLGLIANKHKEDGLVISFWQNAARIAPEWSYFHIELVNYYLSKGDNINAKAKLEYCMQFNFPREHCRNYQNDNFEKNVPNEIGFLKTKIDEEF